MKILSWNVNGLRAIMRKGFLDYLRYQSPNILALQEIKISDSAKNQEKFNFSGYQEFWNSAQKPGYSGTLTLIKNNIKIKSIVNFPQDQEGRIIILELEKFYLANVYFPNARENFSRLDFKIKFGDKLLKYLSKLDKPVLVLGDFNVAHQEIDLARPKENEGKHGFTKEERSWMTKFLEQGFVDSFRYLHPKKQKYSWWTYRGLSRERNVGWRIDYICLPQELKPNLESAFIDNNSFGSDHCPVGISLGL